MTKQFSCPRCRIISTVPEPEVRQDSPVPMPELPEELGHWTMISYHIKYNSYLLDRWNRVIVCPNCRAAHTYFKEE